MGPAMAPMAVLQSPPLGMRSMRRAMCGLLWTCRILLPQQNARIIRFKADSENAVHHGIGL